MKKVTTVAAAAITAKTVQSTVITNRAAAPQAPVAEEAIKINSQPHIVAPDSSGFFMTQYEALLGTANGAYAQTWQAERALIEKATAAGKMNYIVPPQTAGSFVILAW